VSLDGIGWWLFQEPREGRCILLLLGPVRLDFNSPRRG
jgi:hypothetical protein